MAAVSYAERFSHRALRCLQRPRHLRPLRCRTHAPIAPSNSLWWRIADQTNGNFNSEIGWPDLVATITQVRDSLPVNERDNVAILAGGDGEAGAVNLYGPAYRLPNAISGMNSNWQRGFGAPAPTAIIATGMDRAFLDQHFASCKVVAHVTNRYAIENGAIDGYSDIFVCRDLRESWPALWQHFQYFG